MIAGIAGLSLVLFGDRNSGVLPSLVTFVLALQRLNGTFGSITGALGSLNANAAPLELLNNLLEPSDKEFRSRGGIPFHKLHQGIALRNVNLHTLGAAPALTGINLICLGAAPWHW